MRIGAVAQLELCQTTADRGRQGNDTTQRRRRVPRDLRNADLTGQDSCTYANLTVRRGSIIIMQHCTVTLLQPVRESTLLFNSGGQRCTVHAAELRIATRTKSAFVAVSLYRNWMPSRRKHNRPPRAKESQQAHLRNKLFSVFALRCLSQLLYLYLASLRELAQVH